MCDFVSPVKRESFFLTAQAGDLITAVAAENVLRFAAFVLTVSTQSGCSALGCRLAQAAKQVFPV